MYCIRFKLLYILVTTFAKSKKCVLDCYNLVTRGLDGFFGARHTVPFNMIMKACF